MILFLKECVLSQISALAIMFRSFAFSGVMGSDVLHCFLLTHAIPDTLSL
jgi:hypothetical protein